MSADIENFSSGDKVFTTLYGPHYLLTGTGNIYFRNIKGEESKVE
jgi:hypothetical protein